MRFYFKWIKKDPQIELEIAPISRIDTEKIITQIKHDRYYLGRKPNTFKKWFLVGELAGKKEVIKTLNKKEVCRVVGP